MYSYKYVFSFMMAGRGRVVRRYTATYDQDGIHAYTSGFWITSELKFTKAGDCKYWIPPSQILYIGKTGKESD